MRRFVTKGTIKAGLGALAFLMAISGHDKVSKLLSSPDFVEWVLGGIGFILTVWGGMEEGVKPKEKAPATDLDPYPGWDYDPLRGWVRIDGQD